MPIDKDEWRRIVDRNLLTGDEVQLLIDINCDIGWRVHEGDKISVAFASSISMDGALDDGTYRAHSDEPTLLDQYEYAMHGQIFEFKHTKGTPIEVYASYGGMLMQLTGDAVLLDKLQPDTKVYCLMRQNKQ